MEPPLDSFPKHMEKENKDEFEKSFNELISTLPKENGWGFPEDLFQYQDFWNYPRFLKAIISAQQKFEAQPTDIILCSAPKTGTTWLKSLAYATVTRRSFDDSTNPLLSTMPHDIVPFMEMDHAKFSSNRDLGIPLLATHVAYSFLPESIINSGCKIVCICRNPKDSFVSLYHFTSRRMISQNIQPLKLDEAFELFCKGASFYGPYWDHVLGYWKASLEHPDNVLFLKYEELSEDTVFYVVKMAEFIGYPFSSEELQNRVPQKIVEMCSFGNLSSLEVNKKGNHRGGKFENQMFFRKGKVGDWKNILTPEMIQRLDQITLQKLNGSGLSL